MPKKKVLTDSQKLANANKKSCLANLCEIIHNKVLSNNGRIPYGYMSTLIKKNQNDFEWLTRDMELFSRIVLTSLRAAFEATSETGGSVSSFSGKIARRIVTDGILPFSSTLPLSPKTDQLIYTCVVEYIIPTVVTLEQFNNGTDSSPQNNGTVESTLGMKYYFLPS